MTVLVAAVATRSVAAIEHIGGMTANEPPAVRYFDAGDAAFPNLLQRTEHLVAAGSFIEQHDGLFVAVGSELRHYERGHRRGSPLSVWSSDDPIIAVADGPRRGVVLALTRASLTAVRFSDLEAPAARWSYAIAGPSLKRAGSRALVRSGNHVFVADASIPGVRVLDVDSTEAPASLAEYESPDGVVHDLALWGTTLVLVTDAAMVVVDIDSADSPSFTRLGSYLTLDDEARVDANSRYAFLADGATVLVLDIDPTSPSFLDNPVEFWVAPSPIGSVRLDMRQRAYVLMANGWEVLDVGSFGGR